MVPGPLLEERMVRGLVIEAVLIAIMLIVFAFIVVGYLDTTGQQGNRSYEIILVNVEIIDGHNISNFSEEGYNGIAGIAHNFTTTIFNSDSLAPLQVTGISISTAEFSISAIYPHLPYYIAGNGFVTISFNITTTLAVEGYKGDVGIIVTEAS
jgi:hypothetical protein